MPKPTFKLSSARLSVNVVDASIRGCVELVSSAMKPASPLRIAVQRVSCACSFERT